MIFLAKIGEIEVLKKLYSKTVVTREVADEHILPLKKWIEVENAQDMHFQKILEQTIDAGEASMIALALETRNCVVSLDDLRARKVSQKA